MYWLLSANKHYIIYSGSDVNGCYAMDSVRPDLDICSLWKHKLVLWTETEVALNSYTLLNSLGEAKLKSLFLEVSNN